MSNKNSYNSKLVGVTFEGRQGIIAALKGDEEIRFRREPENEYDENAVAVDVLIKTDETLSNWHPIGYIARDKNRELAELLTDGKEASIKITSITGGEGKSFGVNVYIEHERERKSERSAGAKLLTDFFGNQIFYDEDLHEYTNALGEVYLSGSKYASDDNFDGEYWANDAVERYSLPPEDKQRILDMWNTNGEASRNFGTALHAVIELYGKFHDLADIIDMDLKTGKRKKLDAKTEKNSALSKLPYLQEVALKFFTDERKIEKAYYEVLVVDHVNKRAGRIDRLVQYDDGCFAVRDMKTNNKLAPKELRDYTKQLSFYSDLLLANDAKLGDNPVVHHWINSEWVDIKLEKIDTLEVEAEPDLTSTGSLSRQ